MRAPAVAIHDDVGAARCRDASGNVLTHFVTARANGGTDPGGRRSIEGLESVDGRRDDAGAESSPAGVDRSDGAGGGEQDGDAVGAHDDQPEILLVGPQGIPFADEALPSGQHGGGVDLTQPGVASRPAGGRHLGRGSARVRREPGYGSPDAGSMCRRAYAVGARLRRMDVR